MSSCPKCGYEFESVTFGGWTFVNGRLAQAPQIQWTPGEAKFILALLRAQGRHLSRENLCSIVAQDPQRIPKTAMVDVIACRVRAKMGQYRMMELVGSRRNHGYFAKAG